jgi:hypothetical protein
MKIALTGVTGFIGRPLAIELARRGDEVIPLVRRIGTAADLPGRAVQWSSGGPRSEERLTGALRGADAIIHLAGHPVADARWSEEVRKKIRGSRVEGTREIVEAIAGLPESERPRTLVAGSAIGIYGDRGDEILTEASPRGSGFLADVVSDWEAEAVRAEALGVRVVRLRTGIVLGRDGGALAKMKPVVLGSGKQWMSWIHREDVIGFVLFALDHREIGGAFNLVAPSPARNADFTAAYARARNQDVRLRAPAFAIRAALGEMSRVVLDSARVSAGRILASGYRYRFDGLEDAFDDLFGGIEPGEERFSSVQFVPKPIEEVFDFFTRAENLETLTPPWLNFRIVGRSTAELGEGTQIDYRLKIHGVPVRWRSRIERWEPNASFVDSQVRGPYSKWRHTHRFEKLPGGTLVVDEVIYRTPGGEIGNFFGGPFVRKDVERIFAFRRAKIAELFRT